MNFDLPAEVQELIDAAPRQARRNYSLWLEAIAAMDSAKQGQKCRVARTYARRLGVRYLHLWRKRTEFRKRGAIALIDKRWSSILWLTKPANLLPAPAVAHLRKLAADGEFTAQQTIRAFMGQLRRWRRGDASAAIPGYSEPPKGNPPPGWSNRNLDRYLAALPKRPITFRIVVVVRSNGLVISTKVARLR